VQPCRDRVKFHFDHWIGSCMAAMAPRQVRNYVRARRPRQVRTRTETPSDSTRPPPAPTLGSPLSGSAGGCRATRSARCCLRPLPPGIACTASVSCPMRPGQANTQHRAGLRPSLSCVGPRKARAWDSHMETGSRVEGTGQDRLPEGTCDDGTRGRPQAYHVHETERNSDTWSQ